MKKRYGHSDGQTDIQTDKVVYKGATLLNRTNFKLG